MTTRRLSPARAHLERMAAVRASAPDAQPSAAGHAHELLLAQLYEHRKQLKAIQSIERKTEAKAAMVGVYDDYLDGVLDAATGADDPIVTTLMVWNIDAARFERALTLASYVLDHGLPLPDQYHRDSATLLIDEFAAAALAARLPEEPAHAAALLQHVIDFTAARDAPDQARAKLHKAMGYILTGKARGTEPDYDSLPAATALAAREHLARAHALFAQIGVKKDLERLDRRLKKDGIEPSLPAPGKGSRSS